MTLFFVPVFQRFGALLDGLSVTVVVAVLAIVLSLIAGLGLALARRSAVTPVRWLAVAYIDVFRNTPFVVQLFFFYYGLPEIGIFIDALTTGVVALSLAAATSTAEVIRAGMDSVDRGVIEAARAYGLGYLATMRHVILPQAVRAMIPPTVSLAVGQLQVSSLVSIVGVVELTKIGTNLNLRTLAPFKIWPIVALGYFIVSKPLSMLADWSEARLKQPGSRRDLGVDSLR